MYYQFFVKFLRVTTFLVCFQIFLATTISDVWAQCFTVGSASTSTSTSTGDWMTDGNWDNGSPGCSISGEDDEYEVDVDMNLPSTSCGGGDLDMGPKTNLHVVNNSTLTIDGDITMAELACLYVEAGSTLIVLGDFNFPNSGIMLIIDGTLQVSGAFVCSGDCTGGDDMDPDFGGTGTYTAGGGCVGFDASQTQCAAALPIELLYFDASAKQGYVQLDWATASELNNDFFTVEKLLSLESFATIAFINGSGNSFTQLNYSSIDPAPFKGINYYRLKQTDFDGQFSYSNITAVNYEYLIPSLIIFPNPVCATCDVNISIEDTSDFSVLIHELTGRLLFNKQYSNTRQATIGHNELEHLPAGTYLITATGNNWSSGQRIIILE